MTVSPVAIPLRAANKPRAGMEDQKTVWTNDDLERLHDLGLICIVGRMNEETSTSASLPEPDVETQDPEWYAEQAARLRDELERRRPQLGGYRQALEDARCLKTLTVAINHDDGDIVSTPEAAI